jgi:hypothetical protein
VIEKLNVVNANGIYFSPITKKNPNTELGDNAIGWFISATFIKAKEVRSLESSENKDKCVLVKSHDTARK